MTSNGKQFTVTCEMLTAVACDGWNLTGVFKVSFCFVLLYNKSLPSNLNVSRETSMFPLTSSPETLRFSGNKIHCSPRDQSLSVNCSIIYPTGLHDEQETALCQGPLTAFYQPVKALIKCTEKCTVKEWRTGLEF